MFKHLLIVLWTLASVVFCERKTYRLVKIEGNERIPQDITHDTDNTVTIVVGDVSQYKNRVATVNFHDFDTGYVVFKDIRRQICMLSTSPIPFPMPLLYQLGETNITLEYDAWINEDFITNNEVKKIAGLRIASFCNDYKTYPMHLTKPLSHSFKRAGQRRCLFHCGTCILEVHLPSKIQIAEAEGDTLIG